MSGSRPASPGSWAEHPPDFACQAARRDRLRIEARSTTGAGRRLLGRDSRRADPNAGMGGGEGGSGGRPIGAPLRRTSRPAATAPARAPAAGAMTVVSSAGISVAEAPSRRSWPSVSPTLGDGVESGDTAIDVPAGENSAPREGSVVRVDSARRTVPAGREGAPGGFAARSGGAAEGERPLNGVHRAPVSNDAADTAGGAATRPAGVTRADVWPPGPRLSPLPDRRGGSSGTTGASESVDR